MYPHEQLADEIMREGILYSDHFSLQGMDGFYDDEDNNPVILVDHRLDSAKKTVVTAEELGHHFTSSGDILTDRSSEAARSQEERALRWAVYRLIRPEDFLRAYEAGVRNRFECADFLGVTVEFLDETIRIFQLKYGYRCQINQDFELVFVPTFCIHRLSL